MNEHEAIIYDLVQSTLDFCGNTLEAMQDYCVESNLKWEEFEDIRFKATQEYGEIEPK